MRKFYNQVVEAEKWWVPMLVVAWCVLLFGFGHVPFNPIAVVVPLFPVIVLNIAVAQWNLWAGVITQRNARRDQIRFASDALARRVEWTRRASGIRYGPKPTDNSESAT